MNGFSVALVGPHPSRDGGALAHGRRLHRRLAALDLRGPVVAGDAGARPGGAVLFAGRGLGALIRAVRQGATRRPVRVRALRAVSVYDNFQPHLKLHRAIA